MPDGEHKNNMTSKWIEPAALLLLDDAIHEDSVSLLTDTNRSLFVSGLKAVSATKQAPQNKTFARPQKAVAKAFTPTGHHKPKNSLQDMMKDYNTRKTSRAPIKSTAILSSNGRYHFKSSDSITVINIPTHIPGKIIRPVARKIKG
jgi:hypothetical protein